MHSFKQLAELTPQELAALTRTEAPTAPHGSGLPIDATATARAIVKAAATARAGGPTMPKPSTVAQQILDAGAKRRAGG
jgi:hypothetical protein